MPAPHAQSTPPGGARGFSLIELLVATALSGIVLAGAFGVLSLVLNASRIHADQFQDRVDLRVTQLTVRRALESMVAGVPLEGPPPEQDSESEDAEDEEEDDNDAETPEPLTDEGEALSDVIENIDQAAASAAQAIDPNAEPDYFQLYYEQTTDGLMIQRMEIAVREPPVPEPSGPRRSPAAPSIDAGLGGLLGLVSPPEPAPPPDLVRGAFRARFHAEKGWQLIWQPIAPGGEPTVLLGGLVRLEWQVLPPDLDVNEWPTAYAAYLRQDFPFAVRLIIETEGGSTADWVFQTNVITRGT